MRVRPGWFWVRREPATLIETFPNTVDNRRERFRRRAAAGEPGQYLRIGVPEKRLQAVHLIVVERLQAARQECFQQEIQLAHTAPTAPSQRSAISAHIAPRRTSAGTSLPWSRRKHFELGEIADQAADSGLEGREV